MGMFQCHVGFQGCNWVGLHPLYNLNNQGPFVHCSTLSIPREPWHVSIWSHAPPKPVEVDCQCIHCRWFDNKRPDDGVDLCWVLPMVQWKMLLPQKTNKNFDWKFMLCSYVNIPQLPNQQFMKEFLSSGGIGDAWGMLLGYVGVLLEKWQYLKGNHPVKIHPFFTEPWL